jgi:hypothetical protein
VFLVTSALCFEAFVCLIISHLNMGTMEKLAIDLSRASQQNDNAELRIVLHQVYV